jgi:hypothetical protein
MIKIEEEKEEGTRVVNVHIHIQMNLPYLTAVKVVQLAIPPD